jgi:integrase
MKRYKTTYPGVFYRQATRIGGKGEEKIFYVVYKKNGKVHEEKAGRQYADKMTAARAATIRGLLIEGKRTPRPVARRKAAAEKKAKVWTVNALWDEYRRAHPEKKSIQDAGRKFDKNIRPGIGKKEPKNIVPLDIDRIRLKFQRAGKLTTAARVLEILRRAINFGVKRNLIAPLGFKIEVPALNNQTTEDLSQAQIAKLLAVLDKDEDQGAANLMRLALYTGMRKSEILKLKWTDLDFDRGFILLRDPKGGPDQKIPLNDAAAGVVDAMLKYDQYLFPGRFPGTHATGFRKSIARIKKDAKLPDGFRPLHGLRHVFASMLASSGQVDLYTLQRLLTHKSPQMTARYAHLRDDSLKRAANLAGDIITKAANEI